MTGKVLYAVPFIVFGIIHFINAQAMGGYVPAYIPGGAFWVYVTGAVFIVAALAILLGKMTKELSLVLAIQLLVFVALIHIPGVLKGNQMNVSGMLKDLSLAGGALLIASMSTAAPAADPAQNM